MSSQKSTTLLAQAIAPKRQRGRDRVEAILEAATSLFAEKSYDAVTMTEVAARSATAIGSLYRFFPTKEVLAGALLERYAGRVLGALDDLLGRGDAASPAIAAQALIGIVQGLRRDRSVALALIDANDDRSAPKKMLRNAMIERFERLLDMVSVIPVRDKNAKAIMLLHLIKTTFRLEQEDAGVLAMLDREAETIVRLYLEAATGG